MLFLVALFIALLILAAPYEARAGAQANALCVASKCVMDPQQAQQQHVPVCTTVKCFDAESGGITSGFCGSPVECKAQTATGLNGKSTGVDTGLSALGQVLGQLMGKLMQSSGSGSGSGAPASMPTTGGTTGNAGCTSYYPSSVPSSDPCAYYLPNTSTLLTSSTTGITGSDLLNSLGSTNNSNLTGGANVSSLLTQTTDQSLTQLSNTNGNTNTNTNSGSNTATAPTTTVTLNPGVGGAQGNIIVQPGGATIVANTVDASGNTAVAGFYGADTFGGQQPTGLVGQLCQSRPWANNFLSYIIPPSFFDGLCQWQGYRVGTPPPAASQQQQNVTLTQTRVPAAATTSAPASTVQPKVQIWAVPASVPLGARTSVYWTTQGVTNCAETSPDGSFTESSLQGSGATVPLTGATTFTISCQAPDGTPVSDYVTVNIAI